MNFEWDENKNQSNQQKHGIGFEHAREAFEDEDAILYPGKTKSGESRFLIVGKVLGKFIIAVVFTMRAAIYRIISARQAKKVKSRTTSSINLIKMTTGDKVSVEQAISILKAGGDLSKTIISDLGASKVKAMDALLLAENGFIVPDGNIVYEDSDIEYDPDFDEVDWGRPVPFAQKKKELEELPAVEELLIRLQVKNEEMKGWLNKNREHLDQIISKLLEDHIEQEEG